MNRRHFLSVIGAWGLPMWLGACDRDYAPLRIASYVWPGYEFMFLAQREGWLAGENIDLVETGSATESIKLLETGRVDGAALTLDEMMGARVRGLPLTAVLIFDISLGVDVLLAKPGIENMQQLNGKRIAYEPSAVGALMLHKALSATGLELEQVETVLVTFDQHEAVWRAGKVDAIVTFEPVASRLESEDAHRLFDSSQIPDTIFDVLAVTPDAIQHKAKALRHLVAAHFKGIHHLKKNPIDTAYRMAERFHLPAKEVLVAYSGLELPSGYRNLKLLGGANPPLSEKAKALSEFLIQTGILPQKLNDFSGLANADFIPREVIE